jgi:hypothetical protein
MQYFLLELDSKLEIGWLGLTDTDAKRWSMNPHQYQTGGSVAKATSTPATSSLKRFLKTVLRHCGVGDE